MSQPATTNDPLLRLANCTIRFGGLTAVSALELEVRENELIGLIGPNGAGKTTVFNLITGVYRPGEGQILFQQKPIEGIKPDQITAKGIARTFQNVRLFGSMSVFDNVRVAFHLHVSSGICHALWRGRAFLDEEKLVDAQVMEMLDLFDLGRYRNANAKRSALRWPTPAGDRPRAGDPSEVAAAG